MWPPLSVQHTALHLVSNPFTSIPTPPQAALSHGDNLPKYDDVDSIEDPFVGGSHRLFLEAPPLGSRGRGFISSAYYLPVFQVGINRPETVKHKSLPVSPPYNPKRKHW